MMKALGNQLNVKSAYLSCGARDSAQHLFASAGHTYAWERGPSPSQYSVFKERYGETRTALHTCPARLGAMCLTFSELQKG